MKNWVCPESGDMYDKPGPCPDCGVTLVSLQDEGNEMSLREAAQQALEAMEYTKMDVGKFNRINAACQALRAALEQETPPQCKPLTDEEIKTINSTINWGYLGCFISFARAIERAHGIGGEE